jgi:hypothetical protein
VRSASSLFDFRNPIYFEGLIEARSEKHQSPESNTYTISELH